MDKPKRVTPFSKGGSHYRPPSGIPAKGEGWGGPARGGPAKAWEWFDTKPQPPGERKRIGKMEAAEYRARLKAKLDRAAEAYDRALDSDNPALGLAAAKQIEDRVFGQSKQVVETQADTRDEAQIIADIERKRREAGLE